MPSPSPRPADAPLRAAIIGTGYIADFHARAIRAAGATLVAVCDANAASAQAFAARHGVARVHTSADALFAEGGIDVTHVLVPPDHHAALATRALEAGSSVFLEKPMVLTAAEADALLALAEARGLRVGAGHNFLFVPGYQRLRAAVRDGRLGPLDHAAINFLLEIPQLRFGPFDTWMLRAPQNLFLEVGPHLCSLLLDIGLAPDELKVTTDRAVTLPGGGLAFRRWRVTGTSGKAAFTLTLDAAPGAADRSVTLRGLWGTASASLDSATGVVDIPTPRAMDVDRLTRSLAGAASTAWQAARVFADYLLTTLKLRRRGAPYQASISDAVIAFHRALKTGAAPDRRVDGAFGRDVIALCERIIAAAALPAAPAPRAWPQPAPDLKPDILVIGGTGFIGRALIAKLLAQGHAVRALVRGSPLALEEIATDRLAIMRGNAANADDLARALAGIDTVYHLATAEAKTWADSQRVHLEPARLLAEAALAAGTRRVIYTGTIDSYDAGEPTTITEDTPLDPNSASRNYYSRGKTAAEALLAEMHRTRGLPLVVLRPGIVIGEGGSAFHWGVGKFTGNICEVWGEGTNPLPFVLVSDVADALVAAARAPGIEGRSFNLIDAPLLSARDYLAALQRLSGVTITALCRPIWRLYALDMAKWVVKLAVRHPDAARRPSYRDWQSRTQRATFDCTRARQELGWKPASDRARLIDEGIGGALQSWLKAIG